MNLLSSPSQEILLLLAWCIIGTSVAQNDPVRDFCRRWGHQSAVVDRKLYIDGGLINYKPFSSSSRNFSSCNKISDTVLAYNDLDDVPSTLGMPQFHDGLSKNTTIPSVSGGILWEDSVNKRLFLYGGEYFEDPPAAFVLYSYDILYNNWVSLGSPTGAGNANAGSYGAGVSISSRGEAYYYGGWQSNASVPGWTGPPKALSRLIKYDMDKNSWNSVAGPDNVGRAEGVMVFIPIGDAGMLVYFGGSQDLDGNGTLTPQPMDEIFLYDVANTKWYTQKTSGRTPEIRRRFCGGATWAQDQSSYNIYIFGGAGFPPDTTGYDDIYILTIPSFQWIRGPYPANSNVTGEFPKSMMSCNVVDNSQMLVIGGSYSNDTTYSCDADNVWGTHNMNLGQDNDENAIWLRYLPSLTTYAVPTDILTAVGGRDGGGATRTAPTSGFDAPDLSVLMTRKATPATRTPTRPVSLATSSSSNSSTPSSGLSKGAIAGIAVGCGVALLLVLTGCFCFIRRRRAYSRERHASALAPGAGMSMAYHHGQAHQGPMYGGWGSTQVSSPTMTATSPAIPPAELGNGAELQYPNHSISPTSGKHDIGYGGPSPVMPNERAT
ncbi:cell wall anchored protein [Colletotrichum chrysophilum]|uniref:Cell wall anchored protein n=1 Tax=Colletotrichum chrysophilum TaxID=1836956 RepID=A0AAD9AKK6_9PEZI|nr:cell wall anchored protein [Colletotrichum chrysophilum]